MSRKKYCIRCGEPLPLEASFCPRCTASQMARQSVEPPRAGGRRRRTAWLCGAAALVLAAALTGGLLLRPDEPVPEEDTQPSGLSGTLQEDTCQTYYEGADGRLYHVFACFSPQLDGGAFPASHREELLPADEPGTSPLCLFVEDAEDRAADVRDAFRELLRGHTVEAVAAEGSDARVIHEETDGYGDAGALLAHEHQVTSACTYNDIIWTLYMKNGDEITLRQVIECSEKPQKTVSWEDTPLDTAAELQALLDAETESLSNETSLIVQLPHVTYTEPLSIRRPVTLLAHADGTEFSAPITVARMPESRLTDIHVTLEGLRIQNPGEMAGAGVTAMAPTYLTRCRIGGWEQGAVAADGGWIWVQRSDFIRNGTALCIDTTQSSSWGGNLRSGNFIRNGTAIEALRLPGDWMTLYVSNSTFNENEALLAGPAASQILLEDTCFVR